MNERKAQRIIALDIRSQRFGYAVIEAPPIRFLDWGVRTVGTRRRTWHVADLIRMYRPCFVVVRRRKTGGKRDTPGARNIMRAIRSEARQGHVPVAQISEWALKKFFRGYGKRTKHEIASLLAASFTELKWKLPPPRRVKFWRPESARMGIFDATAIGIVFLAQHSASGALQELFANS